MKTNPYLQNLPTPPPALDISVGEDLGGEDRPERQRTYLSVLFRCCNVYQRIYKNAERTAYIGACPRCQGQLRIGIAAGGSTSRTFIAE